MAKKGEKLSEETRRKMSEARKGLIPWNKGKKTSAEHKKNVSIGLKNQSKETRLKMLLGRSESLKGNKNSLGHKHTEETKKRLSEVNKGNKHSLGHKHTEESKKKMSEVQKGRSVSEATRKKLPIAQKGRKYPNRIVSLETKKKISDANSTPERKAKQRQVMRDIRHNQTSPTVPESIIMKILTEGGIKYKFNKNVDYLTPENTHRKKEIDFLIKPKKIIEFNGYRHFDNRNFKSETIVTHHNKLKKCQDIWDEEDTVLNQIKKEGYSILIIWDMDLKKDTENMTKKILKFVKT